MIAKRKFIVENSTHLRVCRILLFCTYLMFFGSLVYGQNLIPNPGFEDPFTQFEYQWVQPQGPYYHYEKPHERKPFQAHGGDFNNGICMYSDEPNEYLHVKLLEPLKANTEYRISVYARIFLAKNESAYAQKYIGVYLGYESTNTHIPGDLYMDPQVNLNLPNSDRTDWFEMTESFYAEGGEQFLTMGYFFGTRAQELKDEYITAEVEANRRKYQGSSISDDDKAWLYLPPEEQRAYLKANRKAIKKRKKEAKKKPKIISATDSARIAAAAAYQTYQLETRQSYFKVRYYFDDFCLVEVLPDSSETCEPKELAEKIEAGATIQLRNVFFKSGEAVLYPESDFQLDGLLRLMASYPNMKIEIRGYTDNVGSDKSNLALSENRALAVQNWLLTNGVDASRLSSSGYGASEFVDTNDTEAGRANNRRVTFYIISM